MSESPNFERHEVAHETDTSHERALDKGVILDKLFELRDELGIDIEESDVEELLGRDDNDFSVNAWRRL